MAHHKYFWAVFPVPSLSNLFLFLPHLWIPVHCVALCMIFFNRCSGEHVLRWKMPVKHDNDERDMSNYWCFCSVSGILFHFWQNACNFSACKKTNKTKHPCLIFWKLWLPLLTCSACIYYFYIFHFYWNGVMSVYGMDRWAKDRTGCLSLVMVVWESSGSHVWWAWLLSRGVAREKVHKRPHKRWAGRTGRGLDSCLQFRLCICVLCNLHYYIFYHTLLTERWTDVKRGAEEGKLKLTINIITQ